MLWSPPIPDLLQGVQDEAGVVGAADAATDDAPGIGVDDEGHIDKPRQGGDAGEVRQPQPFGHRAWNWRLTRSGGQSEALSLIVVRTDLPRSPPPGQARPSAAPPYNERPRSLPGASAARPCARHGRRNSRRRPGRSAASALGSPAPGSVVVPDRARGPPACGRWTGGSAPPPHAPW